MTFFLKYNFFYNTTTQNIVFFINPRMMKCPVKL